MPSIKFVRTWWPRKPGRRRCKLAESAFELYGIFGHPLAHTLSPVMQEAGLKAAGRKGFYLPFDLTPADYRKVLASLPRLILDGFNVTVPYKEWTARSIKHRTPEAQAVGAVNTVYRRGRQWVGTNTDVYGFCRALAKDGHFRTQGKKIAVLGAGGAARAVVYGLAREKAACILILNRHPERARKIVRDFQRLFPKTKLQASALVPGTAKAALNEADLVVNSTSVGMKKGDAKLLQAVWLPRAGTKPKLFYDLIYRPAETVFLRQARLKGHRTLNGMSMLLYQGAKAFECWTGKKAPETLMRRALTEALQTHG